jgi:hypothetical protein
MPSSTLEEIGATANRVAVDWKLNTRKRKVNVQSRAKASHLSGSGVHIPIDKERDPSQTSGPSEAPSTRIRVPGSNSNSYAISSDNAAIRQAGSGFSVGAGSLAAPGYDHELPQYLHETIEVPVKRGSLHIGMQPDEANMSRRVRGITLYPNPPPIEADCAPTVSGKRLFALKSGSQGYPVEMHRGFAVASGTSRPLKRDPKTHTYDSTTASSISKRMFSDSDGNVITRNTETTRNFAIAFEIDSRLRQVDSPVKASTVSLSPGDKNFLPTYDADGAWIDYDSRQQGGHFARRPPRSYDASTLRPPPRTAPSSLSTKGIDENHEINEELAPSSLLDRGVFPRLVNAERAFREFGEANVSIEPGSGPSSLSAAIYGTRSFSVSPFKVYSTSPSPSSPTPTKANSSSNSIPSPPPGGGESDDFIQPNLQRSISPTKLKRFDNSLNQNLVPIVKVNERSENATLSSTSSYKQLSGSMRLSDMQPKVGAIEMGEPAKLDPRVMATIGRSTGPRANSMLNATYFELDDATLQSSADLPRDRRHLSIPDRGTAYLGVPTKTVQSESGEVKSSVQFVGNRGGSPGGRTLLEGQIIKLPADIATSRIPLNARAGVPSSKEHDVNPRPVLPEEVHRQTLIAGGGNAVYTLSGSPYGKVSPNTYVRTDWESLAPVAVAIGGDAWQAAESARNLTATGQAGSSPLTAAETMYPGRVAPQGRFASVHNYLRHSTGLNTEKPNIILSVPPPETKRVEMESFSVSPLLVNNNKGSPGSSDGRSSPSSSSPSDLRDFSNSADKHDTERSSPSGRSSSPSTLPLYHPRALSTLRARSSEHQQVNEEEGRDDMKSLTSNKIKYHPGVPNLEIPSDAQGIGSGDVSGVGALWRSGLPSPVKSVSSNIENVLRTTLTDIHPPNRDYLNSQLGKLSAALSREGLVLETQTGFVSEEHITGRNLKDALKTRHGAAPSPITTGIRSTDIHESGVYTKAALGRQAQIEQQQQQQQNSGSGMGTAVTLPMSILQDAIKYTETFVQIPFPMESDSPRVLHKNKSSDSGSLSAHATYRDDLQSSSRRFQTSRPSTSASDFAQSIGKEMRATSFALFGGTGDESRGSAAPLRTYSSLAEKLRAQIAIEMK